MSGETVRAEIFSYEVECPDRAVLTFTAHGLKCRLALGINQAEFLRHAAPRVHVAMEAAREKRAAEQSAVEPVTDPLPPD